ncbi:MAG TPA: hypothetical protein DDX16_00710 [Candidatus Omnitrophica bacterium]|nr:hypothetical protein [Candidatus Omnitrophota bacterium]
MLLNYFTISSLINALTSLCLCFFILSRNPRSRLNRSFSFFSFAVGFWAINHFLAFAILNKASALFFHRALMAGAIFIPTTFFHFVCIFLCIYDKKKSLILLGYIASFIFLFSDFTPLFITGVSKKLFFEYFEDFGPMYHPFLAMFASFTLYSHYLMFKGFKSETGVRANQIKYILIGTLIGFMGGITNFFLVYNIPIPPVGNCLVTVYIVMVAIAIVKYRLLDINLAFTRVGIFIFVYAFVLGLPFLLGYKYGLWKYATWLMLFLATLGPFIYTRLRRQVEARLLAEDFRKYGILKRFASALARMRDIGLEKLLKLIIYRLVKTMEISCGAIYLSDEEANACIAKAAHVLKGREGIAAVDLPQDNALIRFITTHRKEFLLEDVQRLAAEVKPKNTYPADNPTAHNGINYPEVIAQMRQLNARLVIPSFLDKELLGFLVLGEKASGRPYSEADIEVLLALSGQASLAILNALFTVKLRDREKELADASRIVEIGNLASSTGHQLGNVLNNIMTAGDTILDNDPIMDTLKNNPQAKASFEKIINVIITNASDGDQIIDEIRSYSRQEGDRQYTLVGLKEALDKTLRMLYIQINKFQNIDISINIAADVPPVFASAIGLQNIFVNMFNNAYDSIQEMKEYIKSHPELGLNNYKGRIAVSITCAKGNVNIHLVDNGMGMTVDIAKKLFTPHYTTKASSDKRKEIKLSGGTGIGLYTIRFLVKEYGGTVKLVKTGHLEGAEFLIQIPVPKNGEKEV